MAWIATVYHIDLNSLPRYLSHPFSPYFTSCFIHHFILMVGALGLDALFGDPVYRWHPVRIMGIALSRFEYCLRLWRCHGYVGGIMLFLALAIFTLVPYFGLHATFQMLGESGYPVGSQTLAWCLDLFLAYSLLALRDLIVHANRVEAAVKRGDLPEARHAVSMLVGRDTDRMDKPACRRAALESLAENLTDGVIAPLFWLMLTGMPGLLIFKIASTMDSMVGYRNERYRRFGWFGARFDDLLCWLPARVTFFLLVITAALIPKCSALKAWRIGNSQHHLLPGPNPGWAEATAAGALQRRLIGPLWKGGQCVTEIWIGQADDPEGGQVGDMQRMQTLAVGATFALVGVFGLILVGILFYRR